MRETHQALQEDYTNTSQITGQTCKLTGKWKAVVLSLIPLKPFRFAFTVHFLKDVLTSLCELNKFFQMAAIHPSDVQDKVTATIGVLESRYLQEEIIWGQSVVKLERAIESGKLTELSVDPNKKLLVEQDAKKFVRKVIGNLQARFPERPLIKAFEIFDPKKLPTQNLATYGEEELCLLCRKYGQVVDEDAAQIEWDGFKQSMKTNYLGLSMQDLLLRLVGEESQLHQYPNLAILAQIVLVFPASSVDCERGFSTQNHIKTKTRNQLGPVHLDMLLRLRLLGGPPEQFPFVKAYEIWLHTKKRRTLPEPPSGSNSESDSGESDTMEM